MDVETFAHTSQQLQTPARGDRVARTREAIVGSALALALAGEVAPIVRDIAKMAGVSARTVFQHFADTAELYVAVLGRVMAAALGEVDFNMSWPLDERIAMIINQCSERGERLLPMWTFVETLQRRSTEASEMIVQMYTANRVQLSSWFEHELAAAVLERLQAALNPRRDLPRHIVRPITFGDYLKTLPAPLARDAPPREARDPLPLGSIDGQ